MPSCCPLINPEGKSGTYSSEGLVPDSGSDIDKVLCFHAKFLQPAGDVTAGGGCTVLSDHSPWGRGRHRERMGVTNAKTLAKDKIMLDRTCGNKHYEALLVLISLFVFISIIIYTNLY